MMRIDCHKTIVKFLALSSLMLAGTAYARPDVMPNNYKTIPRVQISEAPVYVPKNHSFSAQRVWRRISASDAKAVARQRVPQAKVVDIRLEGSVYRVRLLRRDGRVIDVFVDAATGRVR